MGIRKLIQNSVAGDTRRAAGDPEIRAQIDVSTRTLSPVSFSTVNSLRSSRSEAAISTANISSRTSVETHKTAAKVSTDDSAETADKVLTDLHAVTNMNSRRQSDARSPLKPHINRNDPVSPSQTTSKPSDTDPQLPIPKTNGIINGVTNGDKARMASSPEQGGLPRAAPSGDFNNLTSSRSAINGFTIAEDATTVTSNTDPEHPANERATSPQQPQWSSAIGKANLGKSGRVIEKLMAENDALKRELKFEKLKSEEAKQAVKMAETKLQQKMSEVETELHEASIIKAQLKRSDRRLADMKAAMDGERQRVVAANEAAQAHEDRAEAAIRDAQNRVNEANNLRILFESRYNVFSGHYKDEEARATKIVQTQRKEIDQINAQKREDARRIATLQDLIVAQDKCIAKHREDYDAVNNHYERYREAKEESLADIVKEAVERTEEQELWRQEADAAIGRLRWALNITEQRNAGEIP